MKRSTFNKAYSLMLIVALAFGHVGVGFFHNKHDAHETVVDMTHTVLLPHGDHCKVCLTDWLHHFLVSGFKIIAVDQKHITFEADLPYSLTDTSRLLTKDRAPPIFS